MRIQLTLERLEHLSKFTSKDVQRMKKITCLQYRKHRKSVERLSSVENFSDDDRERIANSIRIIAEKLLTSFSVPSYSVSQKWNK